MAAEITRGERPDGKVVLFVHGELVPSVPDYDLPFEDYSWMGFLAEAGYDTFAMDQTGYGRSPRPKMDNPCNMDLVGAEDNPEARGGLYDDLTGADGKVLVTMACATHFAVWETAQYKFMHRASLEWQHGTYRGHAEGRFDVGYNGVSTAGPWKRHRRRIADCGLRIAD